MINEFVEQELDWLAAGISKNGRDLKLSWEPLNWLFREMLGEVWWEK